ncbi:MAG: regulatory protein RecX [Nakamurella sp.]
MAEQIAGVQAQPEGGPRSRQVGVQADESLSDDDQDRQQLAAARAICLRLLAVAPRPRAGLAQALRRKEIPDAVAEEVLDRLTDVGLIDDVAYAGSFVRTKHRDRGLGQAALRTELRRLGVDEESMASAVETVDTDAERSRATELIAKRVDAAMEAGPIAAKRRLLGLLSRRGYPSAVAVSVVEQALDSYCTNDHG